MLVGSVDADRLLHARLPTRAAELLRGDAEAGVADLLDRHGGGEEDRVGGDAAQEAGGEAAGEARRPALRPQLTGGIDGPTEAAVGMARIEGVALNGRLDLRVFRQPKSQSSICSTPTTSKGYVRNQKSTPPTLPAAMLTAIPTCVTGTPFCLAYSLLMYSNAPK